MRIWAIALLSILAGAAFGQTAGGLELSLPVLCEIGKSCFIQNYVDVDPGPGARDYACSSSTYDRHKGVDFRVHSAAHAKTGVAVLAAAAGTVKGVRDSIEDDLANFGAHKGRECGNGVVIDHGEGWETQYCHMRRGSIAVRKGEVVAQGQRLGDIGYSGMAEFAHLHLSIRRNGAVIDPFTGRSPDGACSPDVSDLKGLWDAQAMAAMRYEAGRIIAAGFTDELPKLDLLERNHVLRDAGRASEQLILFARIMNMRAGDRIRIVIRGPSGLDVKATTKPIDRNKAMYVAYAGKRRTAPSWPAGIYEGEAQLLRGSEIISRMMAKLSIEN